MAGRTYIFIRSSDSRFELAWDAVVQKLTVLLPDSRHGFHITKPKGENWILIDLTNSFDIVSLVPIIASLTKEDVYGFEYQTSIDAIVYWHYHEGKLIRHFDFGMYGEEERTWNTSVGDPEPWEESVFFSEDALESELRYLEDDDEATRKEILEIFKAKRLRVGSQYPFLGDLGVLLIPAALKFPGAGDGFEPERDLILQKAKKGGFFARLFGKGK